VTTSLPLIMGSSGPVPQTPAVIDAALIELVTSTNPGYTANLPGSLIEDVSSTSVAAILLCGAAQIDLVNSVSPRTANAFILNQLGQIYGVPLGEATNTSVNVVFNGPPGFPIAQGFVVGDGTNQYTISDGGICGSDGNSAQLFALATVSGSFAVPAGTVQQVITAVPTGITLTVNNPQPGTPGEGAETEESYRGRVLQAGLAISQGMTTYLKTLLGNVSGVQTRLVSVRQVANNGGWEIIVGGGDPFQVANAIFTSLFDISTLVGSTINVLSITKAAAAEVVTDLNHGFVTGQIVTLIDCLGMTQINGVAAAVTVIDEKTFTMAINSTGFSTYTGGGEATPNSRNQVVSIIDTPDTYSVPFVVPPQQTVAITLTWNTDSDNPVSEAAMAQLGGPALLNYINGGTNPDGTSYPGVFAGQPMNLFELQAVFQQAVSPILDPSLLTRMVFAVSINGVGVAPETGTGIIAGDPESYFFVLLSDIDISKG
jgi:hypothetical protein